MNTKENRSIQKAAKVAGFIYLITIISAVLNMIFLDSKLSIEGSAAEYVKNLIDSQHLFRLSVAYELLMFSSVVILSVALYVVVRDINKDLAILAMCFRIGEAILGGVAVILGFAVLILINGVAYTEYLDVNTFNGLVKLLTEIRSASYLVLYGFMSFGSIIVYYLLYKSKYVPRALSVYGVVTYTLMLSLTFVSILIPNVPEIVEIILISPGAIFEISIGAWFLFKGLNIDENQTSDVISYR